MKKLHLLLVLCWLPLIALAQDDSSLSVERLWQLERIGQPVASNDGRYIVAPVTKFDVVPVRAISELRWQPARIFH